LDTVRKTSSLITFITHPMHLPRLPMRPRRHRELRPEWAFRHRRARPRLDIIFTILAVDER
jgi:hypothetical protein